MGDEGDCWGVVPGVVQKVQALGSCGEGLGGVRRGVVLATHAVRERKRETKGSEGEWE